MAPHLSTATHRQKKVYSIIESYIKEKGISPTVREIAEVLGKKTPASVQGILNRMEQKGLIHRKIGKARSIQLLSEESNYGSVIYLPVIKKLTHRTLSDLTNVYNIEKYQPVPKDLVAYIENTFIIRCMDNSLQDSGINYQDLLVICRNSQPEGGDIVLALFKNHAIVRKYHFSNDDWFIYLKGDGNSIGRERFRIDEVEIIGKLIGKYTKY